jgi:hypothetical protein
MRKTIPYIPQASHGIDVWIGHAYGYSRHWGVTQATDFWAFESVFLFRFSMQD